MSRWLEIFIRVEAADIEPVEHALEACGALAVTRRAGDEQALFEEPERPSPSSWPVSEVVGLFDSGVDLKKIEQAVESAVTGDIQITSAWLDDRPWDRAWMDQFKPMRFGDDLWICPSWCEPPDPAARIVRLDPGMAFGTGTHETTALCLEWIADNKTINKANVIDFGCGSGVLAIAAAKCGAGRVIAVDIDLDAREATRANARVNACHAIEVVAPDAVPAAQFDILFANILARPLIALAPVFARYLRPHGVLVLSGILREQAAMVLAAYAAQFNMDAVLYREEWARLTGSRNTSS